MKSYKDHVLSTSFQNKSIKVFRSSAIFPILINDLLDCKVQFLSYWFIKNKIKEITCIYSLRDSDGTEVHKEEIIINYTKAFELSIKNLLKKINYKNFFNIGSLEIEFFSSRNLVFPFPAVTINYFSKNCSSFVHTCGRIYNNLQDKIENSKQIVPESGFDISPSQLFRPFFSFVNGPSKLFNEKLLITIINNKGGRLIKIIKFNCIKEYETKFIFFLSQKEKIFLNNQKGSVSIRHNFNSFFPRFLCGNFKKEMDSVSLTHTYYDLSKNKNSDNFWKNPSKLKCYDSIVVFPFFKNKNLTNELSIYPNILKSSKFDIEAQLISHDGKIQLTKKLLTVDNNLKFMRTINFNNFFKLDFTEKKTYFVRLILKSKSTIPSRFKVGYNLIKKKNQPSTNICFNSLVPNLNFLKKPGTFKWGAIINPNTSIICLHNISFLKDSFREAKILMKVWRKEDKKFLKKKITINNNGNLFIEFANDKKIKNFLGSSTGWVSFESDNPFLNGFYFNILKNGSVAGDHLF